MNWNRKGLSPFVSFAYIIKENSRGFFVSFGRSTKEACGKRKGISKLGELSSKLSPISLRHYTFYEDFLFLILFKLSNYINIFIISIIILFI